MKSKKTYVGRAFRTTAAFCFAVSGFGVAAQSDFQQIAGQSNNDVTQTNLPNLTPYQPVTLPQVPQAHPGGPIAPGYVMGLSGQLIPIQPGLQPAGYMVNGQLVSRMPVTEKPRAGQSAHGLFIPPLQDIRVETGIAVQDKDHQTRSSRQTRIETLKRDPNAPDPTLTGQVRIPPDLNNANAPGFLSEIPINADPDQIRALFDGAPLKSLLPEIPFFEAKPQVAPEDIKFHKDWSFGVSVTNNSIGYALSDEPRALIDAWGLSFDAGYKLSPRFVLRGKFGSNAFIVRDKHINIGSDIKGFVHDASGLADFHPFENGFRLSGGAGLVVSDFDTTLTSTSTKRAIFSPYAGIGFDPSLFADKVWTPTLQFGVHRLIDDAIVGGAATAVDASYYTEAQIGIKRRW